MKRFLAVLSILFLLILSLPVSIIKAEAVPIDPKAIQAELERMILSTEEKVEFSIVKICGPEHNVCAVAVDPPYRDFPNVLIFNFDADSGKWVRIFEGLSFGIQDGPSGKFDFHTVGMGIDTILKGEAIRFDGEKVKKMIEISNQNGMLVIPYQDFIHLQGPLDNGGLYTIDKTNYYDLALKIIGSVYQNYPRQECTMFDTPDLVDLQFTYRDGTFFLTGFTNNQQQWRVSFTGIDAENRFLLGKKLNAESIEKQPANEYEALVQKARLESEQNPKNALVILNQAKQINPQAPEAYLYSGKALYQLGQSEQAGSEFQSALKLSSGGAKVEQINIIDTTTTAFKSEKEKQLFKEAYEAIEAGKSRKATQLLTRALKLNPQNVQLYYEIGYAYIELNDLSKALSYLEKGMAINPAYINILNELKYVYAEMGDIQRLKNVISDLLRYYGEDPFLYQELAFAYYQNRLVELAVETLEANLIKFPEYSISYYTLGQIYFLNQNYSRAKELLSVFINNITLEDFQGYNGSLEDYQKKAQEMIDKCNAENEHK